jgi:hypothetical protein
MSIELGCGREWQTAGTNCGLWRSGRQCPLGQMAGESINRNKRKTRGIPLFSEQAIQNFDLFVVHFEVLAQVV